MEACVWPGRVGQPSTVTLNLLSVLGYKIAFLANLTAVVTSANHAAVDMLNFNDLKME